MKFEYYQGKEGNAYELKTDLEQLLVHDMSEQGEEIERLNNIINEALGIANERFNYYSNHKNNNEEHLEDWGTFLIFY